MEKGRIIQIFTLLVIAFFLFQMVGPVLSIFGSNPQQTNPETRQEDAKIIAFTSSMRFVPSPIITNQTQYTSSLANLSSEGLITYIDSNQGFYEIVLRNQSQRTFVAETLSEYGYLLIMSTVEPLTEPVRLNVFVSSFREVGDLVPIEYTLMKVNNRVVVENSYTLSKVLDLNQKVPITETGFITVEAYLPTPDEDFITLLKSYNYSGNIQNPYLNTGETYRFKGKIANITSPTQFEQEITSFVDSKQGTVALTQEINFVMDSKVGKLPIKISTNKIYNKGDVISAKASISSFEGIFEYSTLKVEIN
ncbi:hypothetical protein KO465_04185 [Candidatus Micrarchaeota archaeon]|nr:hypothetical protein [Candidatus Micrarchaeota archaeon]